MKTNNNVRIAKNSMFLYIRMLIVMLVGLYTSRALLKALGVEDYGINNIVGGVVTMFSIVSGSLSTSISRFITYELGKNDMEALRRIFSTSLIVQILMSFFVLLLAETIGLWFLNEKLNIPFSRLSAANFVYQAAVVSFIFNLLSAPYNALIVAYEKMSSFAYISILETFLKLAVVYIVLYSGFDHLKLYAILMAIIAIFIRFVYSFYCRKHFLCSRFSLEINKNLLKQLGSFAVWSFLDSFAWILCTQGINILLNLFFGVLINTARGLVTQIDSVLRSFVTNFMTAVNPQITKSYAKGDISYMNTLVCESAKFSSLLLVLFATPCIIEAHFLLKLWLGMVPEYTVVFLRWAILSAFFDTALIISFKTAIYATGKIKKYQLTVSVFQLLVFPLTWFAYKLGASPAACYIVNFLCAAMLLFIRLYVMKKMINFSVTSYCKNVLIRVLAILTLSFIVSYTISSILNEGLMRLLIVVFVNTILILLLLYIIGLTLAEKQFVKNRVALLIKRR